MKRIYLACPYSDPDPNVRANRVIRATRAAALLMRAGEWVFSPITYGHALAQYLHNHNEGLFWLKQMIPYMSLCDHFYILREDGWEKSLGVEYERVEANRLDLSGPHIISLEILEEHERRKDEPIDE